MGRAVLLVLLLGCAACDEAPVAAPVDAEGIDPDDECGLGRTSYCNPVSQTGCGAGEKCTWLRLDGEGHGELACVADGTVPTAGACVYGADGPITGYDDCVAGQTCVGGWCAPICIESPDSCEGTSACVDYEDHFCPINNFGACAMSCDPVLGVASCPDGFACSGTTNERFTCTLIPDASTTRVHGDTPYAPAAGGAYVNGCAPGFLPLLRASTDARAPITCVATCRPSETHAGMTADADGVGGSGYTCADRGAVAAGTECHHVWTLASVPTLADNDVGFCWQPTSYVGDWDRDLSTPDAPWPSCLTLTTVLVDSNGDGAPDVPEHRYYGCAPLLLGEDPDVEYASPPPSAIGGNPTWGL